MVHIYNGILLNRKREWNKAICSNMDEPRDYHSEVRQRETNIWHPIYGEIYKNVKWSYLQNRNKVTDVENNLMVTRGKVGMCVYTHTQHITESFYGTPGALRCKLTILQLKNKKKIELSPLKQRVDFLKNVEK